jgi:hypothetical protein
MLTNLPFRQLSSSLALYAPDLGVNSISEIVLVENAKAFTVLIQTLLPLEFDNNGHNSSQIPKWIAAYHLRSINIVRDIAVQFHNIKMGAKLTDDHAIIGMKATVQFKTLDLTPAM